MADGLADRRQMSMTSININSACCSTCTSYWVLCLCNSAARVISRVYRSVVPCDRRDVDGMLMLIVMLAMVVMTTIVYSPTMFGA